MGIARRVKKLVKESPFWGLIKHFLPLYLRPLVSLGLARIRVCLRPDPAGIGALAQAYVGMAQIRLHENGLKQAISYCDAALSRDPRCAEAFLQRAEALMRQGALADAVEDYKKFLTLRPGCADVHMALAGAYFRDFETPQNRDEALRHHEIAIGLAPEKVGYYLIAGAAYHLVGQFAKAEEIWHRGQMLRRGLSKKRGLDGLGLRFLADSWFIAVGHLTLLDVYLKMGLLGMTPKARTVFVPQAGLKIPNHCLFDYFRTHVEVVTNPSSLNLSWEDVDCLKEEFWFLTFPDGNTRWYAAAALEIQKRWEAEKRPPLLSLSSTDWEQGKICLKELRVPEDAWYVCLHVREAKFHQQWNDSHPATRDADINTYSRAIRTITDRGGWVIRMGDPSMKPLPAMERVVDYAHNPHKSERMDVFLAASCRFFLGTNSGMALVPSLFGRPCALTNWAPLGTLLWYGDNLWIPKLYRNKGDGRYLTFEELYASPHHVQQFQRHFDSHGIAVVDNTPEELSELVLEMLERTGGGSKYSAEDDRMQDQLSRMASTHGSYTAGRVGREFLRKYRRLLDTAEDKEKSSWESETKASI